MKRNNRSLPPGAEVHAGKSKTLQDIGVTAVLAEGGAYAYLRNYRQIAAVGRR